MAADGATVGGLCLEHVTVQRGQRCILTDVSMPIREGGVTAIVGPSGAGKTTLLGVLNGLIRPTAGQVVLNGMGCLSSPETLQIHRRRTATVFQEHALIDRISALDNVLLGLADRRHPLSPLPWPAELQEQAAAALQEVGLLPHAHARAANLSGGERQRVGIARAMVRQPRLLLGDEPFSALDPGLAASLGSLLKGYAQASGVTVVLVLHQLDMARRLADRIVGLRDGRVCFDGPASDFDLAVQQHLFASTPSLSGEPT
ncbi:MAG: ATP-binding cassette domain-containing protein [Proteobacteria bacterium]|nr:ATP-binding cassette domain-containing protein [Pseudomonadota bacterium]